mgnify:CR=1 FL=1
MKKVLLREITSFLARGVAPKYTEKDDFYVLNQKCIRDWRVSLKDARFTDTEAKKIHDDRILRDNDILVNSTGQGTLGRVAQFLKLDRPATVDSHITIVRPNPDLVFPEYLGYVLKGRQNEIELLAEGSTGQTELSKLKLANLSIDLPPLDQQKKIADILSSLDEKIDLNRRMNETLEQLGQTLFRHYFVDNPEARSWESGEVSDMVRIYSGFAFKGKDFDIDGRYGLVTIKNVQDGSFIKDCTDHLSEPLPDKIPDHVHLKSGDIILSLTGNVGRVCAVVGRDYLLNQRVAKLVSDESQAYVYFLFRSKTMKDRMVGISKGTAQKNLSPIETGKLKIKIPPTNIMSQFEESAMNLLNMIVSNNEQIQNLTSLRDSLLPKLISGDIIL